jgi:hypothetical protein
MVVPLGCAVSSGGDDVVAGIVGEFFPNRLHGILLSSQLLGRQRNDLSATGFLDALETLSVDCGGSRITPGWNLGDDLLGPNADVVRQRLEPR